MRAKGFGADNFKANHKYTLVHTAEEQFLIEESLKSLEEEFGDLFIRVHRNALANRNFIESLCSDPHRNCILYIKGISDTLQVSCQYKAKILKRGKPLPS